MELAAAKAGEEEMVRVGSVAGANVGVERRGGENVIMVEWPLAGYQPLHPAVVLSQLLGCGPVRKGQDGRAWAEVRHTEEVDRLLVELVDLFAEIRSRHPRMVQLRLVLDEAAQVGVSDG